MSEYEYLEPTAWDRLTEDQEQSASDERWLESTPWDDRDEEPSLALETMDGLAERHGAESRAAAEREELARLRAVAALRALTDAMEAAARRVARAVRSAVRRGDACLRRRGWQAEALRRAMVRGRRPSEGR